MTTVFENARVVLEHEVIDGWVAVVNGKIAEHGAGRAPERGIDLSCDYLIPGLVELHTDHLEAHVVPRPKVVWNLVAAVLAYDAQIVASGITTAFDSLRVGSDIDSRSLGPQIHNLTAAINEARELGLLRADHRTHLRCELCAPDVVDTTRQILAGNRIDMISLMDHTPGARQFRDVGTWKTYYGGKSGLSDSVLDGMVAERLELHTANHDHHRAALVELAHANKIAIASHDDTTLQHVDESAADGVTIAEFPTTFEAAKASHIRGICVLMGAPNLVRGGSHSGNVAAEQLAREGVLDIMSSDYVPASLLMGAFELARRIDSIDLPAAMRTVTLNPARATGLMDRGLIAPGYKADLVRVRMVGNLPVVREVYRDGQRVL